MDRILSDKIHTARKKYRCDASGCWIYSGYELQDCVTSDQRLHVEAAQADGWKILPGQKYRKIVRIWEGDFYTYRGRIGMDAVCNELELWPED